MLKYFRENFLQNSQLKKFLGTRFPGGSDTFPPLELILDVFGLRAQK
jgi:hypothetical protein